MAALHSLGSVCSLVVIYVKWRAKAGEGQDLRRLREACAQHKGCTLSHRVAKFR